MNKKISLFIAALALLTSLSSVAENHCQYQVILKTNGSSMGTALLLKSPQDIDYGTVKVITSSVQLGFQNSCAQMLEFLTSEEGQFLTRGCQRMKYECNNEAIKKATEIFHAN
jgi:hypothetical protein